MTAPQLLLPGEEGSRHRSPLDGAVPAGPTTLARPATAAAATITI
ncbi:MAG: hypothetical protein VX460_15275 [Planctomycetota bacterium]|nr:hypothetical protein [Planctomycetota bacterium]